MCKEAKPDNDDAGREWIAAIVGTFAPLRTKSGKSTWGRIKIPVAQTITARITISDAIPRGFAKRHPLGEECCDGMLAKSLGFGNIYVSLGKAQGQAYSYKPCGGRASAFSHRDHIWLWMESSSALQTSLNFRKGSSPFITLNSSCSAVRFGFA